MTPRVSICVPNLNMLPFLPERFESIFQQTFNDWGLFVLDGYSDDGAWDYIKGLAAREPKMRIVQGPRYGPYPAWNECLRQTSGEYVYIATSDDTMASDCMQKMVDALDRHPNCDLAHCPLRVIDRHGTLTTSVTWPDATVFADGMNGDFTRPHIRNAPYDGLLHLTGRHVYLSITQLLIRRSLFDKIGAFSARWGNVSDFNWEMKAGLVANTVHVPDTWAAWRIHPQQATVTDNWLTPERDRKIEEMIQDAVKSCEPYIDPQLLTSRWFLDTQALREYYSFLGHGRDLISRRVHQALRLITGPSPIRKELTRQITRQPKWPDHAAGRISQWLKEHGTLPFEFIDR